jgi:hypothetical protein
MVLSLQEQAGIQLLARNQPIRYQDPADQWHWLVFIEHRINVELLKIEVSQLGNRQRYVREHSILPTCIAALLRESIEDWL